MTVPFLVFQLPHEPIWLAEAKLDQEPLYAELFHEIDGGKYFDLEGFKGEGHGH